MPLTPGTRLGSYEILSFVAAGGMGDVYRAKDTRLNRTVAIKVVRDGLSKDIHQRERFEREALAIARLSHPNICPVFDVGVDNGAHFLVMEYLQGESLAERLKRGAIPVRQALAHAIDIAAALNDAHRHGIVHRDLKPRNIILTAAGLKLIDFGLAKVSENLAAVDLTKDMTPALTQVGTILGTLQYMAPEQLDAKRSMRDLTSLLSEQCSTRWSLGREPSRAPARHL